MVWNKRKGEIIMSEDAKLILDEIGKLKRDITEIKMTLENVTNKNIKIIAEGHMDLSRKLDEALKSSNEKEMLLIRVNTLENEIKILKDRINNIA